MKKYLFLILTLTLVGSISVNAQNKKNKLNESQKLEFDKLFFAGMKEKLIGNFTDAETDFRKAMNIDPSNANIHYELASILINLKRNQEALQEAEEAVKFRPDNEWYNKMLIELYKKNQQYTDAAKICEQYYQFSKDIKCLYEKANLELALNKPAKAIKTYNKIEKIQGIQEDLSRQKEQIYLAKRKLSKATKEIKKLSDAYPQELSYQGMLADLILSAGKEKEALEIYDNILKKDPANGYAAFSLSDYYKIKKDEDKYFEYLKKGFLSNADPKIKVEVMARLVPNKDFGDLHRDKCKILILDFISANSDFSLPYIFMGDMFLQDRNFEESRNYYLKATQRNEGSREAWEQILFCDQQLKKYEWIQDDCLKMIELFPENAEAYFYYSLASKELKQYSKAINIARQGLAISQNVEMTVQMLNNLGDIAFYAKEYPLSDSAYDAALILEPDNSNALNNYAYFLSLRNTHLNKADSMSYRSIQLDPENPSNLDTYGWILFMKKDYELAKTYIQKSLSISPENAEVTEHLGDVLFMLGEKEAALEKWQKAKLQGADSEALNQKIKEKKLP